MAPLIAVFTLRPFQGFAIKFLHVFFDHPPGGEPGCGALYGVLHDPHPVVGEAVF